MEFRHVRTIRLQAATIGSTSVRRILRSCHFNSADSSNNEYFEQSAFREDRLEEILVTLTTAIIAMFVT